MSASPLDQHHHPWRTAGHFGVAMTGWGLLALAWWRVASDPGEAGTVVAIGLLVVAMLIVVVTATWLWIEHNLSIHRRKGPRRSVPAVAERFERDFLGRDLSADWSSVRASRRVEIRPDEDVKRFAALPHRAEPPRRHERSAA